MSKKIIISDIIIYLLNDIAGWFIILMFEMSGYDAKFQNLSFHRLMLVIGFIHIVISILCSMFFYKKERTKYHIRIGNKLLIYNIIMTLFPYLYLIISYIL